VGAHVHPGLPRRSLLDTGVGGNDRHRERRKHASAVKVKSTTNPDIEQVLREKKSFTLRCMLDGIKELQGRVATWNRFASSVSII
jgi:hypothetical protein